MNYIVNLVEIFQPVVILVVSLIIPVFVNGVVMPLKGLLRLTESEKQLEIENMFRDSLHLAASNALKFAMAKFKSSSLTSEVLESAQNYLRSTNPDALNYLNIDDQKMTNILISKSFSSQDKLSDPSLKEENSTMTISK